MRKLFPRCLAEAKDKTALSGGIRIDLDGGVRLHQSGCPVFYCCCGSAIATNCLSLTI